MGHFSMEIDAPNGSDLSGNQQGWRIKSGRCRESRHLPVAKFIIVNEWLKFFGFCKGALLWDPNFRNFMAIEVIYVSQVF